jgi:hypothetical protein
MSISQLLVTAFTAARQRQTDLPTKWVQISVRLGGLLPASLLMASVQREGEADALIRCLEDEMAERVRSKNISDMFAGHYLNIMTTYWIGGIYEILRLLRERKLVDGNEFIGLLKDFELLRMPLEKHEIAKDWDLEEPVKFVKFPRNNNATDEYVYDPQDSKRGHIMPMGVSERGSMTWHVVDMKGGAERWIERRSLSDRILELWGSEAS